MNSPFELTKMRSKNLQLWASDKNPFCAYYAIGTVSNCENMHSVIIAFQQANIASQMPADILNEWVTLYRKPKLLYKYAISKMTHYLPAFLIESIAFRLAKRALKANRKQLQRLGRVFHNLTEDQVISYMQEMCQSMPVEIEKIISEKHSGSADDDTGANCTWAETFLINIHLRCLIEYNEYFYRLYHQARHGNEKSIIKLLRLDPLIFEDKFIRKHFYKADPKAQDRFRNAINNPLKYHTKPEKIKATFAGQISAVFEIFGGNSITPQSIHDLFDAYAKDFYNKPTDEDLPFEFDAFRKAVKKHHKLWLPIIQRLHKELS